MAQPSIPLTPRDLALLLEELAGLPTLWQRQAQFDPSGRWWRRLSHSDEVDVWLLTWLTGHSTDLHDHGGSAGAFTVLQGALTEVRVCPERRTTTSTAVVAGSSVAVEPSAIHDVYNAGPAAAISLHAYSPPLTRMTFYDRYPAGIEAVKTVETREHSRGVAA